MEFSEQYRIAAGTGHVHARWYGATYPEVAELGLDPVAHYLLYGAAMGRNPGRNFDTRFYLATCPGAAASGLNPLVYHALYGAAAGHDTRPPKQDAQRRIDAIRTRLLSLGFTERPLADLTAIATGDDDPAARALAGRELALWHMRARTAAGWRTALEWIARARPEAPDLEFRAKLTVIELLCHHHLNDPAAGQAAHDRAALAGEMTPDAMLAWVNFQPTPALRVLWINQVLARSGLAPVALLPGEEATPYDRLTGAGRAPEPVHGPRVTVLIAAHDAADTLPTALRSLQEQSWANLEIIVLDDCSPGPETVAVAEGFAARDPRIRVARMPRNGGAYVARNHGLDMATGDFVTLQDADDWSHPRKIETQMRFMMDHPDAVACTSQQARARADLGVTRWTGRGSFIITNVSSLLWRRRAVCDRLGYWDTVRFAADSELVRRMQTVFGPGSVVDLPTGPLSFQRDSDGSAIADEVVGMPGFYFGARREYVDAQQHHHRSGRSLKYTGDPDDRPFPAPALMSPDRRRLIAAGRHFDVVITGDFRMPGPFLDGVIADIRRHRAEGRRIGLMEVHDYDAQPPHPTRVAPELRAEIDGEAVTMLAFGDHVSAGTWIGAPMAATDQRYLPVVTQA